MVGESSIAVVAIPIVELLPAVRGNDPILNGPKLRPNDPWSDRLYGRIEKLIEDYVIIARQNQ